MKATAARDQVELYQKKNSRIMRHNKVSKHQQHVRTFQIAVKPPSSSPASSSSSSSNENTMTTTHFNKASHTNPDVQIIAKQLKERLSKAMSKLNASSSSTTTVTNTTTPFINNPIATTANTMTSIPIATTTTTPRLENLKLLRQYLLFVAQETGTSVYIKPSSDHGSHKIEIALSEEQDNKDQKERCDAARLGARLIESHVHSYSQMSSVLQTNTASSIQEEEKEDQDNNNNIKKMEPKLIDESIATPVRMKQAPSSKLMPNVNEEQATPHSVTRRSTLSDRRRRPGRPPSKRIVEQQQLQPSSRRRSHRHIMSYTSIVKCICDTPDEEFGPMVQCDDCRRWLHLDCLKMSEAALGETFRCPLCFVAMGGKQANKLVSSMTWRFAARRQSEQMAAATANSDSETSDFEDHPSSSLLASSLTSNNSIQNRRRLRSRLQRQQPSLQDLHQYQQKQIMDGEAQEQSHHPLQLSIVAPSPPSAVPSSPERMEDDHSSEDSSSPSEASTPEQTFYTTDPFDAVDATDRRSEDDPMVLDSDSFEFFSRLAYLQSLDSGQKEVFTSNASDVFLCDDANHSNPMMASTTGLLQRYPSDTLPSSMCSQLLKEYSFDSGPFWKTMR
ncbi:hypothetical protein BDA99DRAFT_530497 [Phascolomyces articulosus]|uniref:PHD-type domain-containing protein n=1 Tax=Phascolomyces articulosus TaxID=60185 RepID=A0AAD5P8A8_9FUNG|nr:hypothetical protein BDA99DRAFT_530497 [Phascolomyces articulosus]